MSMWALYENQPAAAGLPTRDEINAALSGNLCRCTGYRPIVDAAQKMFDYPSTRACRSTARRRRATAAKRIQRSDTFEYTAPDARGAAFGTPDLPRAGHARRIRPPARGASACTPPRRQHRRRPVGHQAVPRSRRHPVHRQRGRTEDDRTRRANADHRRGRHRWKTPMRRSPSTTPNSPNCGRASRRCRSAMPARSAATSRTARRSAIRCRRCSRSAPKSCCRTAPKPARCRSTRSTSAIRRPRSRRVNSSRRSACRALGARSALSHLQGLEALRSGHLGGLRRVCAARSTDGAIDERADRVRRHGGDAQTRARMPKPR